MIVWGIKYGLLVDILVVDCNWLFVKNKKMFERSYEKKKGESRYGTASYIAHREWRRDLQSGASGAQGVRTKNILSSRPRSPRKAPLNCAIRSSMATASIWSVHFSLTLSQRITSILFWLHFLWPPHAAWNSEMKVPRLKVDFKLRVPWEADFVCDFSPIASPLSFEEARRAESIFGPEDRIVIAIS